jgi:uncharacterized protein (DUF1778 family)
MTAINLELHVSSEERLRFERAAEAQGQTLAAFVVRLLHEAVDRDADHDQAIVLHLSPEDSVSFVEAILDPAPPNAAMQKAERRHRELLGGDLG